MSLCNRILQAPEEVRDKILQFYGQNFNFEVRYYMADFIEDKIFNSAPLDENDINFEISCQKFVVEFLTELESVIPNYDNLPFQHRLIEGAKTIRDRYLNNPSQLYKHLQDCLLYEKQMLHAGVSTTIFAGDQEQMLLRGEMQRLIATVTTNYDLNKQITQEFETFSIQYHDFSKNSILENFPQESEEKKKERLRLKSEDMNRIYSSLLAHILNLTGKFRDVLNDTKDCLEKVILKHLATWKTNQGLTGNGAKIFDNLNLIQEWFEQLSDIIWSTREQIRLFNQTQVKLNPPQLVNYSEQFLKQTTDLLTLLITNAFVIEKQPPQVMKTNTRFTATVRLLTGSKLNIHMSSPQVKVTIVSENQAQITQTENKTSDICSGDILNNTGNMEYSHTTQTLTASFRNMQLKKIKRAEKKGTESVMDEKFSLKFQSSFAIGQGEVVFSVWALSLPVVVIVHGNQEPQSWATITWDNAFSDIARIPFQVPDKVVWPRLAEALNMKFRSLTERGLTNDNLVYLCEKAFKQPVLNSSDLEISWSQFCKEPIPDRNFTFWDWFHAVMKLTREHLRNPWKDGYIVGFLPKKQAEDMLMKCPVGTFLLRFSDSELGGITIAWTDQGPDGIPQVIMLQPFLAKDFAIRSLADRVYDLGQLVTLYPDVPKDHAFGQYYTPMMGDQTKNGYVRPLLVTHVPGVGSGSMSYPGTPQHSSSFNLQSPDHTRDTPSAQSVYDEVVNNGMDLGQIGIDAFSNLEMFDEYSKAFQGN